MEPQRPSRLQEIIRQWILFIPLATAVVGSLLVQSVSESQQAILLPAMFYIGALIVTSAMLHQRYLLSLNLSLNEQLQQTHEQLDDLHHLAVMLTHSLDVDEIARATLECIRHMLGAESCALWLRRDFLPLEVRQKIAAVNEAGASPEHVPPQALEPLETADDDVPARWLRLASLGFEQGGQERLERWNRIINRDEWQNEELHCNVHGGREDDARLCETVEAGGTAICLPVVMKGEAAGAVLVTSRRRLNAEQAALLQNIMLISGPTLHNSLLYRAASLRAEIDGLTNLYNHRATQERLAQEVARVQRARAHDATATLAVATMDVNDFKIFNDTYGHATGDRVLRIISDTLRQTFRVSDVVGRFGGDEFVAILPATDRAGVECLCQRAARAVASRHFTAPDGSHIQIRLTCGVAVYPGDGESAADLLRVSDARLYVAKRRGVRIVEGAGVQPAQTTQPRWADVGVLEALVTAIDNKDRYTRGYCEKVWHYALLIARQMNLGEEIVQAVSVCSLVHDVGKIIVPDSILRKPGRLTPEETRVMQQHTVFGAIIVRDVPHLDLVLGGVRHHHENFDGSGYPDGVAGENIPLLGRLLAVPISFAAMITDRPYRKAMTAEAALNEIKAEAGTRFDPAIVKAFVQVLESVDEDDFALLATADLTGAAEAA